jgi:hypothetical protein
MRRHPPAALDLFLVQRASPVRRRLLSHPRERPREVDRGRPRACEDSLGFEEIVSAHCGERETVGGRDSDRRRSTHGHVPDRVGDLGRRRAAQIDDLVGQASLVEEDDRRAVLLEANDLLGV